MPVTPTASAYIGDATRFGEHYRRALARLPYLPPMSGPLHHGDETSGVVTAAILRSIDPGQEPTPDDLLIARSYAIYYISAPCWDLNPHTDAADKARLAQLRRTVHEILTRADLTAWMDDCVDLGIDPF